MANAWNEDIPPLALERDLDNEVKISLKCTAAQNANAQLK